MNAANLAAFLFYRYIGNKPLPLQHEIHMYRQVVQRLPTVRTATIGKGTDREGWMAETEQAQEQEVQEIIIIFTV